MTRRRHIVVHTSKQGLFLVRSTIITLITRSERSFDLQTSSSVRGDIGHEKLLRSRFGAVFGRSELPRLRMREPVDELVRWFREVDSIRICWLYNEPGRSIRLKYCFAYGGLSSSLDHLANIQLALMVSNNNGERYFSKIKIPPKLIANYDDTRPFIRLIYLSIESSPVKSLSFDDAIQIFSIG